MTQLKNLRKLRSIVQKTPTELLRYDLKNFPQYAFLIEKELKRRNTNEETKFDCPDLIKQSYYLDHEFNHEYFCSKYGKGEFYCETVRQKGKCPRMKQLQ